MHALRDDRISGRNPPDFPDSTDDNGRTVDHAKRARFFFENRVLLRRALKAAIDTHTPQAGKAPLVPLMLGGDDLLLVCRAEIALPFVVTLCETLAELQKDNTGFRLTLGVGVVIAKHTIPIYRLHEVAEQLAGSAKRRVRGLVNTKQDRRSVIDWAVYSSSWVDDPEEIRRRDWIRDSGAERRVLSHRPLDVLGEDLASLAGLLKGAEKLNDAPRSQLRYLVDQLPRGRALSELAFAELSAEATAALKNADVNEVWIGTGMISTTHLLDLVEVHEIAKLGSSAQATIVAEGTEEVVHGG